MQGEPFGLAARLHAEVWIPVGSIEEPVERGSRIDLVTECLEAVGDRVVVPVHGLEFLGCSLSGFGDVEAKEAGVSNRAGMFALSGSDRGIADAVPLVDESDTLIRSAGNDSIHDLVCIDLVVVKAGVVAVARDRRLLRP